VRCGVASTRAVEVRMDVHDGFVKTARPKGSVESFSLGGEGEGREKHAPR
jgi:hypothetical protein